MIRSARQTAINGSIIPLQDQNPTNFQGSSMFSGYNRPQVMPQSTQWLGNQGGGINQNSPGFNDSLQKRLSQVQTGFLGSENALTSGLSSALAQLSSAGGGMGNFAPDYSQVNANRNMAMSQGNQGINALQGYTQPGAQAQSVQAALSGALGNAAQQQAYNNFQQSPGQQWLVDQAERGLLRNTAAIGGLGGGNVRQALQQQAMGLAQQDFDNQFNRMGMVADRGIQGQQLATSLRNQMMGAATSAGAQGAGLQGSTIGANAGIRSAGIQGRNAAARDAGSYAYQTGMARAGGRTDLGSALAGNEAATTSALSNLVNQQGAGMAGLTGDRLAQLAGILGGAGENQFESATSLAGLLQSIAQQAGNQRVGLQGIPQTQQHDGLISRIGDSMQSLGKGVTSVVPSPNLGGWFGGGA